MPEIEINIEIFCAECGRGLCNVTTQNGRKQAFDVGPCGRCMGNKHDEGYEEGYREGYQNGIDKGDK